VYAVSQNKNAFGQDPCTVGSILDASCRGLSKPTLSMYDPCAVYERSYLSSVGYAYPPLTDSTKHYLPPRASHFGDVMCDCSTVMYRYEILSLKGDPGTIYLLSFNLVCTWPALRAREAKSTRKTLDSQAGTPLLTAPTRWVQWIPECTSVYVSQ
jgi:hypothetical protein